MNWKVLISVVALVIVISAVILVRHCGPGAGVVLTLQLVVTPETQADAVAAQANSARFKYEMGKHAGLAPRFAQSLSAERVPQAGRVKVQLAVPTRDAARRYAEGFVELLQKQCGPAVEIALRDQVIR